MNASVAQEGSIPRHVAIVMDGNGRWARKRFMPRIFGHKYGMETVVRVIDHCQARGVEYLTVYAFSSENWKRPEDEVSGLMNLVLVGISKYLGKLASRGVRELNLVAQDLTEYGMEWKYKERLETLLPELVKVEGIEWIRLHYVYPDQFSDELVEIIAREPKIVKYLDMPIQHTNDTVLKSMNRRLTKAKLFDLVGKLREKIPGIVFRTSIIVGFPGETEEQFQELCTDIETLHLDHVGVFRYSKEEGTKAAEMDGQIHANTKRRRAKKLTEILQKQSLARNERYVGTRMPLLVEGVSEESEMFLQGRLPTQAQEIDGHVLINDLGDLEETLAESPLRPGDLIEVEITEAMPHDLVGKVVAVLKRAPAVTASESANPGLATMPKEFNPANEWRGAH